MILDLGGALTKSGDDNERRILRNSAHISVIEAGLDKETDPVAGSYFVEKVAAQLAEKALAG